jgi:hypothetical protein
VDIQNLEYFRIGDIFGIGIRHEIAFVEQNLIEYNRILQEIMKLEAFELKSMVEG